MADADNGWFIFFQREALQWALATFETEHVKNKYERACRFGEEALELLQALGITKSDMLKLVDYVYGRPEGKPAQEVGGTMVTLAVLCAINDISLADASETELDRCWKNIQKIRMKQQSKPHFGPLPGQVVEISDQKEKKAMGLCNCGGVPYDHLYGSVGCNHFVEAKSL